MGDENNKRDLLGPTEAVVGLEAGILSAIIFWLTEYLIAFCDCP